MPKLCKCETNGRRIEILAWIDHAPLKNGYTAFYLFRCLACGGFCSQTEDNLKRALEDGLWQPPEIPESK